MEDSQPPTQTPEGFTTPPPPPQAPEQSSPPVPQLLPWEDPSFPPLEGWYETARLLLFHPREAFSRMSLTVSLGKPVLYAIIMGWVGMALAQLYQWVFRANLAAILPEFFQRRELFASKALGLFAVITAPVWVLLGLILVTLIVHLFLLLFGGASQGLEGTFRVLAYSHVTQLFQAIPLVGGLVGLAWWLAIVIPGLATVHRTSTGRAAGAVLAPFLLCCLCLLLAGLLLGLGLLGALPRFR